MADQYRKSKSRLRVESPEVKETRFTYSDGSRKLYDRDKMPEGLDEDIWHLTLFFEQVAESYSQPIIGRPIAYTELRHRIHASNINSDHVNWVDIVESMIRLYWKSERDTEYSINSFCNIEKFDFYYKVVVDDIARKRLIATGVRTPQPDREKKPSKSSETETKIRDILTRSHDEGELAQKLREFRDR